ncbi:CDP-glucose 4,6-dehydratase [Undibacterium sp. FT79W]|uniref:CDP-glucose 4,6-dehydratase n=1 Tax=Undibacterium sp. FT79W TaxID=2762296 RepID=UPI00351C2677
MANMVNTSVVSLGEVSAFPASEPSFWQGRRVLLTGHTGFKGAWLAFWLLRMGATVTGLALAPRTSPDLFDALGLAGRMQSHIGDIRDAALVRQIVAESQPEIVLHLAAQALVRPSYKDPLDTFSSNVMGTANVLDALRGVNSVRVALMVTTDKVYRNRELLTPYPETAELGGHDPYSASKAASELVIAGYRSAFLAEQGVTVAVARAGNVIGGGDWSEDRLLPDAVRAWQKHERLQIRRPESVRPWQHVLEPVSAYLTLAQRAYHLPGLGEAWNFGPDEVATVREVVELAQGAYGGGEVDFAHDIIGPHEAGLLALDVSKARRELGIRSRWDLQSAVRRTMCWYRDFEQGVSASDLCERDLDAFLLGTE